MSDDHSSDENAPDDATSFARAISLAALLGAAVAPAFVAIVSAGQGVLWPDQLDPSAFSGSIKNLIVMNAGGLVVGVINTVAPSGAEENVFVALATSRSSGSPSSLRSTRAQRSGARRLSVAPLAAGVLVMHACHRPEQRTWPTRDRHISSARYVPICAVNRTPLRWRDGQSHSRECHV